MRAPIFKAICIVQLDVGDVALAHSMMLHLNVYNLHGIKLYCVFLIDIKFVYPNNPDG